MSNTTFWKRIFYKSFNIIFKVIQTSDKELKPRQKMTGNTLIWNSDIFHFIFLLFADSPII